MADGNHTRDPLHPKMGPLQRLEPNEGWVSKYILMQKGTYPFEDVDGFKHEIFSTA